MNNTEATNLLNIPTRQSPIAVFLILWKVLRQLLRQVWPFVLILILQNVFNFTASRSSSRMEDGYITKIFFALTIFSTISSIISYFKYYYYIQEDEFVIERGLFQKVKINLPFDRIQTINFEQGLIHRLFDVVRMEIDSAGSMQSEISIQAINRAHAEYLRSFIMSEKEKTGSKELVLDIPVSKAVQQDQLLMQHSPLDLLKIGVSQNHLRGLGIIFGFAFWIFQSVEDFLPELKEGDTPEEYMKNFGVSFDWQVWAYFLLLLVIASVLISLVSTIFSYFNLRFIKTEKGFKVISGLFTRREQSANIHKIQLIRWDDSLLKRQFGIFRLYLFQASSAALSASKAIGVPGCYEEQVNTVRAAYFPKEEVFPYEIHGISPLIIGRRVLYMGILPALLLLALSYQEVNYHYLAWLLLIPFSYVRSLIFHKNWKVHINQEGVLTEQGIFGKNYTLLQWYKVQSVTIRQSLYQRRKQVADVYFFTAAGSVKIPYFPLEKALAIQNYVLYKVETDNRTWM